MFYCLLLAAAAAAAAEVHYSPLDPKWVVQPPTGETQLSSLPLQPLAFHLPLSCAAMWLRYCPSHQLPKTGKKEMQALFRAGARGT